MRGDPLGIKGEKHTKATDHFNGKKEHYLKNNKAWYHFRWETKEEDMQSGVRALDDLNPTKRALNEDKLAKFMTTNKDVWSSDQSPDYLVIDNFVDFFGKDGDTLTQNDLLESRKEADELTSSSRLCAKSKTKYESRCDALVWLTDLMKNNTSNPDFTYKSLRKLGQVFENLKETLNYYS